MGTTHTHLDICPDRAIDNEQTNLINGLGAEESSRGFVDIDVFLKQTLHFLKSLWHLYREVVNLFIRITEIQNFKILRIF